MNEKKINDIVSQKYDLALQFTKFKYEFNKFMDYMDEVEKELINNDSVHTSFGTSNDSINTKM